MFQEAHVARLHSATTCYTCVPNSGNSHHETSVATESHALHLTCHSSSINTGENNDKHHHHNVSGIKLETDSVPRPKDVSPEAICVGYSTLTVPAMSSTETLEEVGEESIPTKVEKWEAFILLAPSVPTGSASVPSHSMTDDTTTVVTTTDHTTGGGGGGRQQRSSAMSVDASIIHNSVASVAVTTESLLSDPHHHQSSHHIHQKSWIVLRHTTRLQGSTLFSLSVPFRPLSPHLTSLPISSNDHDAASSHQLGLWVGSADDELLRFYAPCTNDHTLKAMDVRVNNNDDETDSTHPQIQSILGTNFDDDQHDGEQGNGKFLSFSSPIMAIDSVTAPEKEKDGEERPEGKLNYYLAIACQDGTVRIVTFATTTTAVIPEVEQETKLVVTKATANTVIVDGPIVALSISITTREQQQQYKNQVQVVVGSLCGFACCLLQTRNINSATDDGEGGLLQQVRWNEPSMIVEGLWDNRLHTEDAILAVHSWNNFIAVGTYSGACMLWQESSPQNEDGNGNKNRDGYNLVWQCQLPFSIHGIVHCKESDLLLVTTKHTLHVFRSTGLSVAMPRSEAKKKKFSSKIATTRLDAILRERRNHETAIPDTLEKEESPPITE